MGDDISAPNTKGWLKILGGLSLMKIMFGYDMNFVLLPSLLAIVTVVKIAIFQQLY